MFCVSCHKIHNKYSLEAVIQHTFGTRIVVVFSGPTPAAGGTPLPVVGASPSTHPVWIHVGERVAVLGWASGRVGRFPNLKCKSVWS